MKCLTELCEQLFECSMNGAVIAGTPISVDFWQVRRCLNSRLFFLSHLHSDHTVGLTSSWNGYKIYCSQQTKALLISKLRIKSDLVVGLPVGESVVLNVDECGSQTITVTLIDAHHCPGSVMFLFEGYFGNILYTGDFRFTESTSEHPSLRGKAVDILYLDNTYCNPACEFPSRAEASLEIIKIIRKHPGHKVKIGLRYLGKENLLVNVAAACKCWIGVDPAKMETLKLLEMPYVFTCDMDETLVNVVTLKSGGEISKRNMETWNAAHPTIAIIPTALFSGSHNPYQLIKNVFVVPYSDHSSYSELMKFVEAVKPRKIIPIVGKPYLESNISYFDHLLDRTPAQPHPIPPTVSQLMGLSRKCVKKLKVSQPALRSLKGKKPGGVMFDESPKKDQNKTVEPQEFLCCPERNSHSCATPGNQEQPKLAGVLDNQEADTLPQDIGTNPLDSTSLGEQYLDSSKSVKPGQETQMECTHPVKEKGTDSGECSIVEQMLYLCNGDCKRKGFSKGCHSIGEITGKWLSGSGQKPSNGIKRKYSWEASGTQEKNRKTWDADEDAYEIARRIIESMDDSSE